jgi:sugar fermentation stimulation protein A
VARKVLQESIEEGRFPSLASYQMQHETRYGLNKRADVILQGMEDNCFVNVYSVSWVEKGDAFFPDSRSARICEQVGELADVVSNGHRAMVFLFVQRGDAQRLRLVRHVDPLIVNAVNEAHDGGVEVVAFGARVTPEEISLADQLDIVFDEGKENGLQDGSAPS